MGDVVNFATAEPAQNAMLKSYAALSREDLEARCEFYERFAGLSVQIGQKLELHSASFVRGATIATAMLDISKSKDRSRKDRAAAMLAVRQWLDELSATFIPQISWPESMQ